MSTSEGETSKRQVIRVDVDPPLVNNMQLAPKPQEEPCIDIEIDHKPWVSGGVQYYILVSDRYHHLTKPP